MESVHQRVTIYATIIQRVFEKGKGRMVGSLMDSLGSRGRLVSESFDSIYATIIQRVFELGDA